MSAAQEAATRSDGSETAVGPRRRHPQPSVLRFPRGVRHAVLGVAMAASFGQPSAATILQQGAYMRPPSPWDIPKASQVAMCRDRMQGVLEATQVKVAGALASAESFVFGACGGAAGAAVMFPVEAIKMRMQAGGRDATFDSVLRSALKHEGLTGLYQGLRATVVGVAPEKAVMFGVNGVLRQAAKPLEDERGLLPLGLEMGIGGLAGMGQVLFSSPKEMVMVQMQMASQQGMAPSANSPITHMRRLGLSNLYRGSSATLLRDVPFAAMYFAAYSRIKVAMQGDREKLAFMETLAAATVAALPAAFFTTPADVIKTRMQAAAGITGARVGIPTVAAHIWKTEGVKGFFVGAPIRVGMKAPNLGVALLVVEILTQVCHGGIKLPSLHRDPPAAPLQPARA